VRRPRRRITVADVSADLHPTPSRSQFQVGSLASSASLRAYQRRWRWVADRTDFIAKRSGRRPENCVVLLHLRSPSEVNNCPLLPCLLTAGMRHRVYDARISNQRWITLDRVVAVNLLRLSTPGSSTPPLAASERANEKDCHPALKT